MTVDGSAIADPKNVRVPIGMNVGEIIDFCGGFKAEPGKIITGGPMMGLAVVNTDIPVLKQNNAILAFAGDASKVRRARLHPLRQMCGGMSAEPYAHAC